METDAAKASAAAIVTGLKKTGIDFVATLPDEKMVELIRAVEKDPGFKHVPLCREEEGIGICAGAYLAGRLIGMQPRAAARLGHAVAAEVIGVPGALAGIDREAVMRKADTAAVGLD